MEVNVFELIRAEIYNIPCWRHKPDSYLVEMKCSDVFRKELQKLALESAKRFGFLVANPDTFEYGVATSYQLPGIPLIKIVEKQETGYSFEIKEI